METKIMAKGKNTLEIKKFNKDGLIELRDFYHANKKKKKADISIPSHLCADPLLTMSLDTPKYIDLDKFYTNKNISNRICEEKSDKLVMKRLGSR